MKIVALLALLLHCSPSLCQVQSSDRYIMWNKEYKLKFDDFRLKIEDYRGDTSSVRDETSGEVDVTTDIYYDESTLYYYIYSSFDRDQSFALTKDEEELSKEQFVFNMHELLARQLRCRLQQKMTKQDVGNESFLDEVYSEWSKFFRKELDYANYPFGRLNARVLKSIDSLDEYREPEGKIILK